VLARCLEKQPEEIGAALQRYDAARVARANRTKASSMDMLKIFHDRALGQIDTARPYIERNWSPAAVRERYDWLLAYDATTVEI